MLNPAVDIRDFLIAEKSGFAGSIFVDFLIRLVATNREVSTVSKTFCVPCFVFQRDSIIVDILYTFQKR